MEIVLGVIAGLEAIIIVVLLVYLIRNKKQMSAFIEQAQEIKKRRIDLDDIEIKDQNREQMIMADAINAIKNNMQTFLEATKGNVVVLSDAISDLTEGAGQNEKGSAKIAESLSEVVSKIEEQKELVYSCLNLIEDNNTALTEIDDSIRNISGLLYESVDSCKTGVDNLEKYELKMKSISDNLARSEEILVDFSSKISEINAISNFIIDISESLNLLALNASIEAARVGAAGVGFTVVAKEMSVMSEKTQEGIGNINSILESIISSSAQVNECIHECVSVFNDSSSEFNEVSASFRTIDRQSGVINDKMGGITHKVDIITDNSRVTKERAQQAFHASEMITAGTQEISQVSEMTSANSGKISENVRALDSMLMDIQFLLRQFVTSVQPVRKADRKIRIGVFCILDNDFWYSVRRGAIYAQKELEPFNAEVVYVPYTSWDKVDAEMAKEAERMVKEGFDGFVFPGFMQHACEQFDRAYKSGKKVFCFNCDCAPDHERTAVFQPDVKEAGIIAARSMDKALHGSGKVVILQGDPKVAVNHYRCEGFKEQLSSAKGIKIVDTVFVEDNDADTYKKACDALKNYPDITGMFITTGMPLAAARAIEESGRNVSLVVFDHSEEIFKYIKKGIISAAIGQDPFGQGHDPIVWMFNSIVTGKPLPSDNMKCRANVVDKNNVDSLVGV